MSSKPDVYDIQEILTQLQKSVSFKVNEDFELVPWDEETFKLRSVNTEEFFGEYGGEYDLTLEGVEAAIEEANGET